MDRISKTDFKSHALQILREIEQTGESRIITDHGKPTLQIKRLRQQNTDPLEVLKGTVIKYEDATAPVADDAWENAE